MNNRGGGAGGYPPGGRGDFAGGWRGDHHNSGYQPRGGGRGRGRGRGRPPIDRGSGGEPYSTHRYDNGGGRPSMRGGGAGGGGIQGRNGGDHHHHHHPTGKPGANGGNGSGGGGLVPVKPKNQPPVASMAWRVLYAPPAVTRPEVGPTGEQIPGPFSPPLRPSTPEQMQAGPKKPQDVLRKHNEIYVMKQRVHQLLQQAANSPSGGYGTYVGKVSYNNNSIIPVLPRPDPQ
ncbi:hypothetical protein GQ54DRAFT_310858 [Martensiomyces pterosporus]|nr:hypothetical protein GQ54DRAFT_310858 [Martensiomyces pterosporus]